MIQKSWLKPHIYIYIFLYIQYPLVNVNKKLWKDPPCSMGKSTISMAIFNSYVWHNQRVAIVRLDRQISVVGDFHRENRFKLAVYGWKIPWNGLFLRSFSMETDGKFMEILWKIYGKPSFIRISPVYETLTDNNGDLWWFFWRFKQENWGYADINRKYSWIFP